jgi:SAM-dependent MidA family methyltransferase
VGEADARPAAVSVPPWLARALERRANARGFVAFDGLVDASLYSPGGGYYATPPSPLGTAGDFYTAPHVHPVFGATLARRIMAEYDRLGRPSEFGVAELGPGDGTLARDIVTTLADLDGPRDLVYYLIDRPSPLLELALEAVRSAAARSGISLRTSPSLGALGPFSGVVVANELLDALPFRRFRRTGAAWEELGVRIVGDAVEPASYPTPGPVPTTPLPVDAEDGVIVEINTMAEALVREVGDHLVRGAAVFLDYGEVESALLQTRPRGTWTAIADHRVIDDPLSRLGTADQSVFVNLTRLRWAAARAGLVELALRPQREALVEWGLTAAQDDALARTTSDEAQVRVRLGVKKLLFGFERFWAWELAAPAPA